MASTTYPIRGLSLAPAMLRELLAVPVPANLRPSNAPVDLCFADLRASSWVRYEAEACRALAEAIVHLVPSQPGALPPVIAGRRILHNAAVQLPDLTLSNRAANGLRRWLRWRKQTLADLTIGQVLSIPHIGARSLLEILAVLEALPAAAQPIPEDRLSGWRPPIHSAALPLTTAQRAELERWARGDLKTLSVVVRSARVPPLPPGVSADRLIVRKRTSTVLNRLGVLEQPERFGSLTVAEVLDTPGCGRLTIGDLLQAIDALHATHDTTQSETRSGNAVASNSPLPKAVAEAVARLLALPAVANIHANDPRLRRRLAPYRDRGESLPHYAERMARRALSGGDPDALATAIHGVTDAIERFSTLTIHDELLSVMHAMGDERRTAILMRRRGWDGKGGATLQVVGDEFGLTRERVRQICDKAERALLTAKPWMPQLQRAIAVLLAQQPQTEEEATTLLAQQGIPCDRLPIALLPTIAQQCGLYVPTEAHQSLALATGTVSSETRKRVVRQARRAIEQRGACSVELLESLWVAGGETPLGMERIRAIVSTLDGFVWLDEAEGWFWLKSVRRNWLVRHIRKLLAVAGCIRLAEMRSCIQRDRRKKRVVPPQQILMALCRQLPECAIDGDSVRARVPLAREKYLSAGEQAIIRVLEEAGGALHRDQLVERCQAQGMTIDNLNVMLSFSTVILRIRSSVYGLPSADIAPGVVDDLAPRSNRLRRILDHGWEQGSLWIAYRLSRGVVEGGVVAVPSTLQGYLLEGDYTLRTPSGTLDGRLTVRRGSIWGFRSVLGQMVAEPSPEMKLVFDLRERTANIVLTTPSS